MSEQFEHHWEESDVEKEFVYDNRPCVVVQNPNIGHYCAYTKTVLPSLSHSVTSYFEGDNYINLIEVHGGITYGIDSDGWVGFDCAHCNDVCWKDGERVSGEITDKHRDDGTIDWEVDDVVEEVKRFADQISALEQYLASNFPTFNNY